MKSCVINFYKSNKNYYKEDYESAYICSYLKTFGVCDIILYTPLEHLTLTKIYDLFFIKLYDAEQIKLLKYILQNNCIDIRRVFFFGQFSRNNYLLLLKDFSNCNGVIIEDEFDTISSIMQNPHLHEGLAYMHDTDICKHPKLSKHINIEQIPKADRTIAKKINQNYAEVIFSRGCKKKCSFCTIASSNFYDCKSNYLIIDELKEIILTTGIHEIVFKDLSFDDRISKYGKDSLEELGQLIIQNNLNIKYNVNFCIGTFSHKNPEHISLFQILRKSGLVRILLGVESFINSDLVLYNKKYTVDDIIDTIELCRQNFIYPVCSFIFINPYSTLEQLKNNLCVCHHLGLLDFLPASLNTLRPEKESFLYKKLLEDKLIVLKENMEILWQDQDICIISKLFQCIYNDKKIWRTYIWISKLHDLAYELEYLGVRSEAKPILANIYKLFNDFNDINYNYLLSLINTVSTNSNINDLKHAFDTFLDFISNKYIHEFKALYRNIRKEIEIMKKLQSVFNVNNEVI